MSFSPTDAAFEGFRVTRRHPVAVLAWAAVMLAANVLSGLAIVLIAGPAWAQLQTLAAATSPDPNQISALFPRVGPAVLVYGVVQIGGAAIVNASVLRALLRPERAARLRLGPDEVRIIGLLGLFVLVCVLATVALSIVLGFLGAFLGAGVLVLSFPVSVAVLLFFFIRLSLAGPMTIAEHRFRFRESWASTSGHGWALLGSEALAAALAVVVVFLAHVIFVAASGAIVVATGGRLEDVATMFNPDFSSLDKLTAIAPLAYIAFASVLYAMVLVLLIGPPVELYRTLAGGVTDADPPRT